MTNGVLFVHSNFPAQFADLARSLAARGVACAAIGGPNSPGLRGMSIARWNNRQGSTPGIFPLASRAEADLIRSRSALDAARRLRAHGCDPALIIGHPGWGEMALLADAFPDARQIAFHEFYYRGRGLDIDFDTEFKPPTEDMILAGTTKNAVMALSLAQADAIVAPTRFQADTLPPGLRPHARIIHEGVDTEAIRPGPAEAFQVPYGPVIEADTPVITHVNRNLEPLRGLHILLRALPRLQAEVPQARTIIVGSPANRPYGGGSPDGRPWKDFLLDELDGRLDMSRIHFTGALPHDRMLAALRLSTAHVYYSYPFVLSWSLAEAMASGCYVVGSDTAPVRDAISDGVNGKLLDFFDVDALSGALIEACRTPHAFGALRAAARATAVETFDRAKGRAAWMDLIREVAGI
ncbi:glycosyltransferase [Phenylobacterium sp.]|uniref:glycosyltransferase n=1 Tax=Phenylobacterium sp. TaxID=1871053 RepID=UPI002F42496C